MDPDGHVGLPRTAWIFKPLAIPRPRFCTALNLPLPSPHSVLVRVFSQGSISAAGSEPRHRASSLSPSFANFLYRKYKQLQASALVWGHVLTLGSGAKKLRCKKERNT